MITSMFPADLIIFRTTNAAWMRWGNFPIAWPPAENQTIIRSTHVVRMFNDIAIHLIKEAGYDVKVYDVFWMSWSRPDDTEISSDNAIGRHLVHLGHDTLKASLRKLFTMVLEHFGCFNNQVEIN